MDHKGHCAFDLLLSKSVPHVLEKIFFSLDYESFKNCQEVCNGWKKSLTSERFQRKASLGGDSIALKCAGGDDGGDDGDDVLVLGGVGGDD